MNIFRTVRLIILVGIFLFAGCKKEHDSSDIVVKVNLIDENEYALTNNSGVNITLSNGQEKQEGASDSNGECIFYNLPYGIFNVKFEKDGFISQYIKPELKHYENDSINIHLYKMLEIPKYQLSLDSIIRKPELESNYILFGYGKLHNTKGLPKIQYHAILYFSNDINISKDNYLFSLVSIKKC